MSEEIKDEMMEEDEIITLVGDNGEEVQFNHIATLDYKDDWYIFLQPVELGDLEEDEMLIFKIESDEEGNDLFVPLEDEELINAVYAEYEKEFECNCGDDCDCDGDCDCGCCDKE